MLQAIFEYQTAVARLLDLQYANASLYDGGTALYEAIMMAVRHTRRSRIVISESVNPIYRVMLDSYTTNLKLDLVTVPHRDCNTDMDGMLAALNDDTAAVIVQNPNFFGTIEDFTALFDKAREHKIVSVISTYPVMQSILKTPGEDGRGHRRAEGQSLGRP
jgi:glycine dehydrogenase subunit 1